MPLSRSLVSSLDTSDPLTVTSTTTSWTSSVKGVTRVRSCHTLRWHTDWRNRGVFVVWWHWGCQRRVGQLLRGGIGQRYPWVSSSPSRCPNSHGVWQRIILTLILSLITLPSRRPPPRFSLTLYPSSRVLATNWSLSVNVSAPTNLLTNGLIALERGIALGNAKCWFFSF